MNTGKHTLYIGSMLEKEREIETRGKKKDEIILWFQIYLLGNMRILPVELRPWEKPVADVKMSRAEYNCKLQNVLFMQILSS